MIVPFTAELAPQLKAENKKASANFSNVTKHIGWFTVQTSHHCSRCPFQPFSL